MSQPNPGDHTVTLVVKSRIIGADGVPVPYEPETFEGHGVTLRAATKEAMKKLNQWALGKPNLQTEVTATRSQERPASRR